MALIPLRDNRMLEWTPTTALCCAKCREPIEIMTLCENTSDCTNFMFDAQPVFPGQLAQGDYFYLHKRCSWIYGWLIREGADVSWAWYDMPWVLGCDRFMDRHYGSMPRFLRRFMPAGAYEDLVRQWQPAVHAHQAGRKARRGTTSR